MPQIMQKLDEPVRGALAGHTAEQQLAQDRRLFARVEEGAADYDWRLWEAGATAVIQPGGSLRDAEITAAADEHGMAMIHTGVRHFRH